MSSDNYDDTNEILRRVVPELASEYAQYPMKRKVWLDPSATIDNGDPAFIPHKKDVDAFTPPMKQDYIWGTGPRGFGYYHLLTRDAYVSLNATLRNASQPSQCTACCSSGASQQYSDYEETKTIVYNRSVASRPDDFLAQEEAVAIATGTAQMAYHTDQNFQAVAMGFITTAHMVNPEHVKL